MKNSQFITQKDNLDHLERQAFTLRKRLTENQFSIKEIGEVFPLSININKLNGTIYLNPVGEQLVHMESEEVAQLGMQFWQDYFEPERFKKSIQYILKHWRKVQNGQPLTYWNEVRDKRKSSHNYSLYSNTMIVVDHSEAFRILVLSLPVHQLGLTNRKVTRLLEEHEMVEKYFKQFQQLTEREKEIINLLVRGYNNPQVGEQLFIARTTVETHRKNINRKLGFSSYFQLLRFAQAFDLV